MNYLLLLEDVCVFAETKFAEQLREICSFERWTERAAIAARHGDTVHIITAAKILLTYWPKHTDKV